jgi:hypothetical protein
MAKINIQQLETTAALVVKAFGEGEAIVATAEADAAQLQAGQTVTVTLQPNVKVGEGGGKNYMLKTAVFTLVGE